MRPNLAVAAAFLAALVLAPAAAQAKDTLFWNLTANTITALQLSEPGKDAWGPSQTANDKDGSVDHDERLKITGVKDGAYDVRFTDAKGRTCVVKAVEVKVGKVFTIDEKAVAGCKA